MKYLHSEPRPTKDAPRILKATVLFDLELALRFGSAGDMTGSEGPSAALE